MASDIYAIVPSGEMLSAFRTSLRSFSIWPFYLTLLAMIWSAKALVL